MQDTMVGKKFGNLVVQKLAYRGKDSKKYWECQCGCGRVCLVQESHLKNGHTKSCGCLRKKRMTNRWLDLTGQRYGRLVVQRLANQDEISAYGTGKEGEPGKIAEENAGVLGRLQDLWLCRCDCGNVCVCQKENLRDGKTKSCGCFRNETRQKNMRNGNSLCGRNLRGAHRVPKDLRQQHQRSPRCISEIQRNLAGQHRISGKSLQSWDLHCV